MEKRIYRQANISLCRFRTKLCKRCLASQEWICREADGPQLVQEIESQAVSAQREINTVKATVSAKQRDIRMLELTSSEVKQLSKDTRVYEGVGKM